MTIEVINADFSVCKVKNYGETDLSADFTFIGKTDRENSLVCETSYAPENTIEREDGWRGFRVSETLDFSLVGILSKISTLLAEAKIGIFAVSTYDTDYIFMKKESFDRGIECLSDNGYEVKYLW